jgi:ParB/RepB/Spo0J family partition protein
MSVHTQITRQVAIKLISLGGVNVRTHTGLDKASIAELAASIIEHGLLQPVVLRPNSEEGYDLIAGQRRTHACIMAGITEIPAVIVTSDDAEAATLQLVENLQREQLSLSETAEAVRSLLALHGKPKTVAEKLNKSAAWVSKHLTLTAPTFPAEARGLMNEGVCQDLETLITLGQIAKQGAGGKVALVSLVKGLRDGQIGREKVRDALNALKAANAPEEDEEGEGEGEGEEPTGRATITFELSASQAEQFEALGGAQWLRRQLKKLAKATA